VNNELERKDSFFDRRADSYETHIKNNIEESGNTTLNWLIWYPRLPE